MADEEEIKEKVFEPEQADELTMAESLVRDVLTDAQDTMSRDNESTTEATGPQVLETSDVAVKEEGEGERSRHDSTAEEEKGQISSIADEASENEQGVAEEVVTVEAANEEEEVSAVEDAPTVVETATSEELALGEFEYAQPEEGTPMALQDDDEEIEEDATRIGEAFEDEGAGLSLQQDTRNQEASGFIEGSETFFHISTSNIDQTQPVAAKPKSKVSKQKHQEKGFTSKATRHSVMEARKRDMRRIYPNGPYQAKPTDEGKIAQDLRKVTNPHDYFGYLFSAQSQRPPNYYYRYILPVYKQPLPRQHMCITGERVPMEKIHREKTIQDKALPMSTLKIRWRSSRLSTVYKLEDLYAYLTIFGEIDGVYSISVNSALLVFSEIESARAAMMCPCLGFPWDPLIAEWVEPRMNNFGFYNRYLRLEEPLIHLKG